jgi:hypothetical protein
MDFERLKQGLTNLKKSGRSDYIKKNNRIALYTEKLLSEEDATNISDFLKAMVTDSKFDPVADLGAIMSMCLCINIGV